METIVKSEDDGETKTHVGITVAKGLGRFRLILTCPYHEAGQIVEIPQDQITSIASIATVEPATVEPCNLGDDPIPSD